MSRPHCGFTPMHGEYSRRHMPAGAHKFIWDGQPKRLPRKGERYISGAFPYAYIARTNLDTPYFIAIPLTSNHCQHCGKPTGE